MSKRSVAVGLALCLTLSLSNGLCVPSPVGVAKAKKVAISEKKMSLLVGQKGTLKLKNVAKKNAKKISWKSSKKAVASVSKNGVVKGKKVGKANITATYKKKKYTCKVTVEEAPSASPPPNVDQTKLALFTTEGSSCYCPFNDIVANEFRPDIEKNKKYNNDLAKCSLATSLLSESVIVPSDIEYEKSDLQKLVESWGFEDFEVNEDYKATPTSESAGVACAIYNTKYGFSIIGIFFRSIGYGKEWASNMDLGTESNHKGFTEAMDRTTSFISKYAQKHQDKDCSFWITGQSRGAALANLTAANLASGEYPGIYIGTDRIFAYCFATPRVAYVGTGENKKDLETGYEYIHNCIFDRDIVSRIPLESFGFDFYGVREPAPKTDAIHYYSLQDLDPTILNTFMDCKDKDYGGLTPAAWTDSYTKQLAELFVDRKTYVEQWQRPATYMLETFFGGGSSIELTEEEQAKLPQLLGLFASGYPAIIIDHYPEVEYAYLCAKND